MISARLQPLAGLIVIALLAFMIPGAAKAATNGYALCLDRTTASVTRPIPITDVTATMRSMDMAARRYLPNISSAWASNQQRSTDVAYCGLFDSYAEAAEELANLKHQFLNFNLSGWTWAGAAAPAPDETPVLLCSIETDDGLKYYGDANKHISASDIPIPSVEGGVPLSIHSHFAVQFRKYVGSSGLMKCWAINGIRNYAIRGRPIKAAGGVDQASFKADTGSLSGIEEMRYLMAVDSSDEEEASRYNTPTDKSRDSEEVSGAYTHCSLQNNLTATVFFSDVFPLGNFSSNVAAMVDQSKAFDNYVTAHYPKIAGAAHCTIEADRQTAEGMASDEHVKLVSIYKHVIDTGWRYHRAAPARHSTPSLPRKRR